MKDLPDAVPDELAHHAVAVGLRPCLDGAADVAHAGAGPHRRDAVVHRLAGDLHEPPRCLVDLAHQKRLGVVAVDAADVDRHVAVHDVAVAQLPVVGDAVADDLVRGSTQRLWKSFVIQWTRVAVFG